MVSRAVREEALVFAVTENLMVAPPDPLATSGTSHETLSLTCQLQPDVVVTVTLPDPAAAASVTVDGATAYEQVEAGNTKAFESRLLLVPPGPLAATRA